MQMTTTKAELMQNELPELCRQYVQFIDRSPKTAATYIKNLKMFVAWLKYSGISRPVRADIIAYRQYLMTEHDAITLTGNGWEYRTDSNGDRIRIICKPNTVTAYLRSVCAFFKWAATEGRYQDIAANIHTPKIRHDTHRKEALTGAEVGIIAQNITSKAAADLDAASTATKDTAGRIQRADEKSKRLYAMYLLTVTAGLRTIEISRANVKDLESKGGCNYLYIWGKGHTEPDTKKPIAPEVAAALQDYLNSRTDNPTGTSPLFVATGNRSGGKRLAVTTISTMLKRAMQAAGFNSERLTAHSLRHTAGTATMQLTGDLYQTQKYMRHSNPTTTEIYLHLDTEQQEADIAQRLYNYYQGNDEGSSREQLGALIKTMNDQQIEQLTGLVKAMAR